MIGGGTRLAAVIGWPVEHSRSPALHNAAFAAAGIDACFVAAPVAPDGLAAAVAGMRAMGFLGASVTVPHKRAVMALCDRVVAPADTIGAVNCLVFESGGIVGHNTDAGGYVDALAETLSFDPAGQAAVLLGGGGAARAVAAGLLTAGASGVTVVARTPSRVTWTAARPWTEASLAELLPDCALLVDCTSAGLSAEGERALPAPIPLDVLAADAVVSTLVYHRETQLLRDALARGLRIIDGAGMLVHQGARAFRLWTDAEPPIDAMWRAMGRRES